MRKVYITLDDKTAERYDYLKKQDKNITWEKLIIAGIEREEKSKCQN